VDVLDVIAGAAHVLVAAAWFGAMAYSLAVVQPRAARFLEEERRREAFAATLAAGARYGVLAVIAVLALSGGALVLVGADEGRDDAWWALIGLKVALLALATAVFARVSWRLWPQRLFAGPDELPGVRRRFLRAAYVLTAAVAVAIVAGVAAAAVR
jgi:uncharacterized membrane protein